MYITDPHAPVYQKKCTIINATPERVWRILTDIDQWPKWMGNVRKAKINGPLLPDTTFKWHASGFSINSTIHIVEPFSNFGWSGRSMGIFAIHNWSLTSFDGATSVTVSESMQGLVARIFRKSLNRMLENDMIKSLEYLRIECEKEGEFLRAKAKKVEKKTELAVH